MKIIQILYSGLGGHSSVAFSFIEADEHRIYDHVLLFYGIEDMPQSYISKCKELGVPYFFVKKKHGLDLSSHKKVKEILSNVAPDIILLHSVNLIVPVSRCIKREGVRLISVEHQPNHLKTKLEWLWSVLLMRFSDKVVFLTTLYAEQMKKKLGLLFQTSKIGVINNGINTNVYKPSELLQNENNTIGMLARLSVTKDHITLVEAFRLLLDKSPEYGRFRLKIAGDGDMKTAIQNKINELKLNESVDMVGMLPEHLNPAFLNSLGIYVHASLGETMSTSLMQAMACGKPIIASDVKGINNMIIQGETGLLVAPKDPSALANEIEKLILDTNLQDKLSANALKYSDEHFTNKLMFTRYTQLFD